LIVAISSQELQTVPENVWLCHVNHFTFC